MARVVVDTTGPTEGRKNNGRTEREGRLGLAFRRTRQRGWPGGNRGVGKAIGGPNSAPSFTSASARSFPQDSRTVWERV